MKDNIKLGLTMGIIGIVLTIGVSYILSHFGKTDNPLMVTVDCGLNGGHQIEGNGTWYCADNKDYPIKYYRDCDLC